MAIRTILLHAAPDSGFQSRLDFSIGLARQTGARIRAIYTLYPAGVPAVGRALSIYINELRREASAKQAEIAGIFDKAMSAAGLPGTWEVIDGEVASVLRDAAFAADLVVVSETEDGSQDDYLAVELPQHLALGSDGPVIIVPTGKPVPAKIGRVLIAWKPSREAGHAVRLALPLLALAEAVEVLTIGDAAGARSGAALTSHLAAHGVKVEHLHREAADAEAADLIRAEFDRFRADLLVLGAYSRSRFAELVLGGVTRSFTEHPPGVVLLAH
ncbi:universal stress protein [Ancylobacter terrae]|uniref:universal stress protein n=1 Tax=Ancylobacter sp. sgz301288 TaxID=3342077 RepID=UPI00385E797C